MENYNNNNIHKKKKIHMQINSGELNKSILYYINEARTSPKDFSRHLMINDDVSAQITKLSLFFKYSSKLAPPLELHQNLEISSLDLLYHIISLDDCSSTMIFSKKEKERNNLKERLKKYNLIPENHVDLIVIGVDNAIETLSNIFINSNHRKKILHEDMKYIGIASGLLPSGRICIVIDIVSSFSLYNNFTRNQENEYTYKKDISPLKYNYIRFTNVENDKDIDSDTSKENYEDNNSEKEQENYSKNIYKNKTTHFIPKNLSSKTKNKIKNKLNTVRGHYYPLEQIRYKLNFDEDNEKIYRNKNLEDIGDLRISRQKCFIPSNRKEYLKKYFYDIPQRYRVPLNVSIEKNYTKNKFGEMYPIYHKKTFYNDGSILLQPYFEE